jgi:hypothetical protein
MTTTKLTIVINWIQETTDFIIKPDECLDKIN